MFFILQIYYFSERYKRENCLNNVKSSCSLEHWTIPYIINATTENTTVIAIILFIIFLILYIVINITLRFPSPKQRHH